MAQETAMVVPANPNVVMPISHSGEQAAPPSPNANGTPAGNGNAQTPAEWSVTDESLKSKGWKTQGDMERSYRDLESKHGQTTTEYQKMVQFLQLLDPHAEAIRALLAGEGNNSAKPNEVEKLLRSKVDPMVDRIDQMEQTQVDTARQSGIRQFAAEHPDIEQHYREMTKLLEKNPATGVPLIPVRDVRDPNAYVEAMMIAYNAVRGQAGIGAKEAAGRAAATVAGGGRGHEQSKGSRANWEIPREELERRILAGEVE